MRELIGFVLICTSIGASVYIRRRLGLALDYHFFLKLTPVTVASGSALTGTLYPFFYSLVARAIAAGVSG